MRPRKTDIGSRIAKEGKRITRTNPASLPAGSVQAWQLAADAITGGTVIVQDEGLVPIVAAILNFCGAGVTVTDVGGVATITITGGGGGGGHIIAEGVTPGGDMPAEPVLLFGDGFDVTDVPGVSSNVSLDVDESPLSGLLKLLGRAGGQTAIGDTAASGHLTLQSTAHATRGYVRAQDDFQLLSNIIRDAAGTARVTLAAASPHVTLDARVKVVERLSVVANPSSEKLVNILGVVTTTGSPGPMALYADVADQRATLTRNVFGVYGAARAQHTGTAVSGGAYGLFFYAYHDSALQTNSLTGIYLYLRSGAAGAGALPVAYGLDIAASWQAAQPAAITGIRLPDLGGASVTTVYGLLIPDQTVAGGGTVRLLELGPATPYLRLRGGAAPGAGLSNLDLNVGGTLQPVSAGANDSGGAGFRLLRVPN